MSAGDRSESNFVAAMTSIGGGGRFSQQSQSQLSAQKTSGLRSEQVKIIIGESFWQFHGVKLLDYQLKRIEEDVFGDAFLVSARIAAKSILKAMDDDEHLKLNSHRGTFSMESSARLSLVQPNIGIHVEEIQ